MLNDSSANSKAIKRIKIDHSSVIIFLSFLTFARWVENTTLEIVTYYEDQDMTNIYRGLIPKKDSAFELTNLTIDSKVGFAKFTGQKAGGEIEVPLNLLEACTRFFVRLYSGKNEIDDSDWVDLSFKAEHIKTLIQGQTLALIPCYNAEKFIYSVAEKTCLEVKKLILINDGSTDSSLQEMKKVQNKYPEKIEIITYEENQGKGHALIVGFKQALKEKFQALVCLDADGQHHPGDVIYLAKEILDGYDLAIGTRLFKLMPFRSRFSNSTISFFLKLFYPQAPVDTQSGMRAFNYNFTQEIVDTVKGGCYELEFEILLLALRRNKKSGSLPISTIYIDKNKSSHFKPLRDSYRIIKVFFLHIFRSIALNSKYR